MGEISGLSDHESPRPPRERCSSLVEPTVPAPGTSPDLFSSSFSLSLYKNLAAFPGYFSAAFLNNCINSLSHEFVLVGILSSEAFFQLIFLCKAAACGISASPAPPAPPAASDAARLI